MRPRENLDLRECGKRGMEPLMEPYFFFAGTYSFSIEEATP
jgi:hypothetical protein